MYDMMNRTLAADRVREAFTAVRGSYTERGIPSVDPLSLARVPGTSSGRINEYTHRRTSISGHARPTARR